MHAQQPLILGSFYESLRRTAEQKKGRRGLTDRVYPLTDFFKIFAGSLHCMMPALS